MKTWILLCNTCHSRLYASAGKAVNIRLVREWDHPKSRSSIADLVTDQPGSGKTSAGIHGWKMPSSNPKTVEQDRFAMEIARILEKGHAQNSFERLVLASPPHFLGLIREHLSATVQKKLFKAIPKDFIHLNNNDLEKALEKYL